MKLAVNILVLGLLLLPSAASAGLVPVECVDPQKCGTCEFVSTVNNVVQFIISVLAPLIIAGLFVWGGILMVTSAGDTSQMVTARKMFGNAGIGLVIVLAAFLIVNTFVVGLVGGNSSLIGWNEIQCTYPKEAADIAPPGFNDVSQPDTGSFFSSSSSVGVASGLSCDPSQITRIDFLGQGVSVNKSVVGSLERIDAAWRSKGGNSFYRVTTVYGYNCRAIAGSSKMSQHSYGLAIDINPMQNPHLKTECRTDMPPEFVSILTSNGWQWGCNWTSSKDAMHFSVNGG